jgi:hypothetical protein
MSSFDALRPWVRATFSAYSALAEAIVNRGEGAGGASHASDQKDSTTQLRQETAALRDFNPAYVACGSWPFSNSGPRFKLSVNILAGSRVLSAVGACPPHDGVR